MDQNSRPARRRRSSVFDETAKRAAISAVVRRWPPALGREDRHHGRQHLDCGQELRPNVDAALLEAVL